MRQKRSTVNALAGTQRGDLSIIKIDHFEPKKGNYWLCRCKCGKEVILPTNRLMSGSSRSCPDCGKRKNAERAAKRLTTHGLSKNNPRLFAIWKEIISRCSYKGDTGYKYYGAVGLAIADEWKEYPAFYEWAMSHGYRDDLSIDRIDNAKGYNPDNCRWETDKVQGVNHSNSILVTINGTTMCLNDWARAAGVWRQTVYKWRKAGIMEQKISKRLPNGYTGRKVLIKGQEVTLYEEAV